MLLSATVLLVSCHRNAGDAAASGAVSCRAVAADHGVIEHQRAAVVAIDASAAVDILRGPPASDGQVGERDVRPTALHQQHPAQLIRVDLDAGAAVDGDVGGDRELAAGEDNPAALHLGREVDPVGGGGIGVGER